MLSVVQTLQQRAALHPDRPALIRGDRRISYAELWARIMAAARELARSGVVPGDRVLLAAPSVPAFIYGYFGAHALGAVAVPFDPNAPVTRRDDLISRIEPKQAFGPQAEPHATLGRIRSIAELDDLSLGETAFDPPDLTLLADLLFTTGTTGRSKGVRLTQRNIAVSANHINAAICGHEDSVEVLPLPLYHAFGLGRLRCGLIAGRTFILVDGVRLPGEIFSAIEKHRATGLVSVPAGFAVLLRFGARGLGKFADQLRYVEIGSSPMPAEHKQELMALLPKTELWMHYGLTEAARSFFIEFHRHSQHLDTVGLAAPGVQLSVRDEDGAALAPGQAGTLWIGGAHISPGYWDDPELTAKFFVDGWACTGDFAHVDEQGFVTLHGRRDDMIKVGGYNVSPDEVEQVLGEHPAVSEAGCIGIPDPRNIAGSVVRAYLVAAAGQEKVEDAELSQWLAKRLEPYKVPVQYVWLATLPRTASGKLVRASLRNEDAPKQ